jgi:hypothetical protein
MGHTKHFVTKYSVSKGRYEASLKPVA